MIARLRDTRRRTRQQIFEVIGLAETAEDSDFQAEYAEYKGTVNSIRHMQASMRAHCAAMKKQCETSAALSVEFAAFHRGTIAADGSMALGQVHADLERVQLAAILRLYEEEIIAAADLLLWQVPEVEERMKQRKKLLLDYNAYQRKYTNACHSLNDIQNQGPNATTGGLLRRGKSESELSADVATRKVRLDHAEAAVNEATEWLLAQFRALLDQRESGKVLGGPMAAFYACQQRIMSIGAMKLDRIKPLFPAAETYDVTLSSYEKEFAGMQQGNDLFADFNLPLDFVPEEGRFGESLPDRCPRVVLEAIEFLNTRLETEKLFQTSGNQDVVLELRERYDAGETDCFKNLDCAPHDVASTLKRYLADLPDSLIPKVFYQGMVDAMKSSNPDETIADIIAELPEPNIVCLSALLQYLYRYARRSEKNRMTPKALATYLGPTILRYSEEESISKVTSEMPLLIEAIASLIESAKRYELPATSSAETTKSSTPVSRAPLAPSRRASSTGFPPASPSSFAGLPSLPSTGGSANARNSSRMSRRMSRRPIEMTYGN